MASSIFAYQGLPDMSRNMALAGKTVSSMGMNVTYNDKGYAVSAVNFNHKIFAGTKESVRAPSIEAVLAAGNRKYTGTGAAEDLAHFSDHDLERVEGWKRQLASGEITAQQAHAYVEMLRNMYGYSLGANGNEFVALEYDKQPGEVMAAEREARIAQANAADAQTGTASAATTQAAAPQSATQQMQDAYQEQLRRQQEQQAIRNELNGMRVDTMLKSLGEQKKDELFDMLFEDKEKEENEI